MSTDTKPMSTAYKAVFVLHIVGLIGSILDAAWTKPASGVGTIFAGYMLWLMYKRRDEHLMLVYKVLSWLAVAVFVVGIGWYLSAKAPGYRPAETQSVALIALLWLVIVALNWALHVFFKRQVAATSTLGQPQKYADIPTSTPGPRGSNYSAASQGVASSNTTPQTGSVRPYPTASASNEPPALATLSDEALYELALNEITDGTRRPGLWAMALAQTSNGGNPDGAYIALRVEQLRQETLQKTELAGIARDSRVRLAQQGFLESVAAAQHCKETSTQFNQLFQALVLSKNPLDVQKLIWLCDFDTLRPGDDPRLPDKYIVRRSPGDEPFAVFATDREFVNWALTAFVAHPPQDGGYI